MDAEELERLAAQDRQAERERIAPALGKVSSGLYIATAQIGDEPIGMLCSFVEQCSFEPPMISLALGKDRALVQALDGHGLFGLHILSKENNPLMKGFLNTGGVSPFEGRELVENLFGIPQLAEAWAYLGCKVAGRLVCGDHLLFTAEVFEGTLQHPGQEAQVRVRPNGFKY